MRSFAYKAVGPDGHMRSGVVEAATMDEANSLIAALGDFPVRIRERRAVPWRVMLEKLRMGFGGVATRDLIVFTKQMSTMIRTGVPILEIMRILEKQTENRTLRRIAVAVGEDVKAGASLSDALAKHPRVFPPLYCSMVHAGEASGTLPDVLNRLIYVLEHEAQIRADIRSAIQYPVVVVIALCVAFVVLLTFVVPKFVSFFQQAKLTLPLPTRICLGLSALLTQYWYLVAGGIIVLAVAWHKYVKTAGGRYVRDSVLVRVPIVGPLLVKAAMSRFASIFAILQSSGVLAVDAIRILAGTIGNAAISRELTRINELLEEGGGISGPLRSARYFPPMVVNMVAVGEESGKLDEMLREVSAHYDAEVRYAIKRLTDAIGPVLIVFLAVIVGFFALAIYLPIWDLTKMARMTR